MVPTATLRLVIAWLFCKGDAGLPRDFEMHSLRRVLLSKIACALACACLGVLSGNARAANLGRPVFNIVDYGAPKDGSAPATEAFRRAIAAARAAGGGTIFVPAGRYTSGPIVRKCRAFPGTNVFLSTAKGELPKIILHGNVVANAKAPVE